MQYQYPDGTTAFAINDVYIRGSQGATGPVGDYVISFNGVTGTVTGITAGGANIFTALNTFNVGIYSNGATFNSNVYMTGDLIVTGRIVTSTGVFGATANALIEPIDNMIMDGGEF
jgi:hypothetical protein